MHYFFEQINRMMGRDMSSKMMKIDFLKFTEFILDKKVQDPLLTAMDNTNKQIMYKQDPDKDYKGLFMLYLNSKRIEGRRIALKQLLRSVIINRQVEDVEYFLDPKLMKLKSFELIPEYKNDLLDLDRG